MHNSPLATYSINERLLQFIWQFQYFNKKELSTTDGNQFEILHGGYPNTNQGPDFLDARIRINGLLWAGHIEIHINASQWYDHHHDNDVNYRNVVLHVVWINDKTVNDSSGKSLPTLELQPLVASNMLQQYQSLMQSGEFVACAAQLPALSPLGWMSWKERLVAERFERKAGYIFQLLEEAGNHWEEVFWWLTARNFGIPVNGEVFERIARTIPVTVLAKSKYQLPQIEAMLLGQANLLNDAQGEKDSYFLMLQKEYEYCQKKYQLSTQPFNPSFLRMRPAAFPTIRLAQLAMLIHTSSHLFSTIRDTKDIKDIYSLFEITANDYWHYHYTLNEESTYAPKKTGTGMINNILINTVAPILFAYGMHIKEDKFKLKALQWLEVTPPEQNNITRQWTGASISNKSALDSQSLLELKGSYCDKKRCLECAVGNKLLKNQQ